MDDTTTSTGAKPSADQLLSEEEKQADLLDMDDPATQGARTAAADDVGPDLLDPDHARTDPTAPDFLDDETETDKVPMAPGEGKDDDKEGGPDFEDDPDDDEEAVKKARGMATPPTDDDDDIEDFSTPFEDEGGFDDKKDDDVELFDDEDDEEKEPLADAKDGTKKKKRRMFTRYKKKTYTEKEPSKAEKRRRRRAIACLICCCCLILLIILLLIFLVFKKDEPKDTVDDDAYADEGYVDDFFGFGDGLVPDNVQTTPMDPWVKDDCDFSDQIQPHVISQCLCYGKISIVADDIRELYTLIKTRLMPELYTEEGTMWNEPITSCDPRNQALLWLSSGDVRRSGDLVQKFLTSTAYIAMNGTKWDYQNLWMTEANECLWLGLQCNERFQIHTLALDTINIFGTVRTSIRNCACTFSDNLFVLIALTSRSSTAPHRTPSVPWLESTLHHSFSHYRNNSNLPLHDPRS
jgi:hypothetical protein